MISKYFIVWSFIPISLLLLSVWGLIKSRTGRKQAEPVRFYFRQFVFSFIILCLSELFIFSGIYSALESYFTLVLPEGFLAWIVFPSLLLLAALLLPGEKPPSDVRLRNISRKKKK